MSEDKKKAGGGTAKTNAMGMKCNYIASECWKNQVLKEQQIRDDWIKTYIPSLGGTIDEITERVRQREEAAKEAAKNIPERHILHEGVSKDGTGRALYLKKRNNLLPQLKFPTPQTSSQLVGWKASDKMPEPRNQELLNYGHKPVIQNGFYRGTGVFSNAGKETKFY